ncbi:MAG: glycerol-3-phosphate dehydrogenase [Boseongicola sp. SB0662_bin_57]|nr:glycerol-3-phosphate dehydrogenase [Boseongicola sp. SB0662_bin_57]
MTVPTSDPETYDLFVIGGGINGCGIARDAAGRGLKVGLAEMNDLASATSSGSTKLFHGGLRYLEHFEFRLVREALVEREVLLRAMPHIAWPMRFVLPFHGDMRFEGGTPMSRILGTFMPWMRGRRPAWLIRLGLLVYDHLGGREILSGTVTLSLKDDPAGAPLDPKFVRAYEYSDCWVQDARLVVLNARDAAARGAKIMTRTKVVSAERSGELWNVRLETGGKGRHVLARMLVNAGGPWVGHVIRNTVRSNSGEEVRLVRGSHIVTRKLYDHDKAYFFQGTDGRIIFAIPYEDDFTLIGTTDLEHSDPHMLPVCTEPERDYLLTLASRYFRRPVTIEDVVWTFSGVRPLYNDGAASATAATRDYVLKVDDQGGAPLLNIFGGKISTYRRLAEVAMEKVGACLNNKEPNWTAGVPLPGGDLSVDGVDGFIADLQTDYPFLTQEWARRLVRTYGTDARNLLGDARVRKHLGQSFGGTVTARELDWVVANEWVRTVDDFLWRRTKLGLKLAPDARDAIAAYLDETTSTS